MSRWSALLVHPRAVAAFYRRLAAVFGVRFVLIVFAIYGLSQGIGESLAFYATKYLFTDAPPDGFDATSASYQVGHVPPAAYLLTPGCPTSRAIRACTTRQALQALARPRPGSAAA